MKKENPKIVSCIFILLLINVSHFHVSLNLGKFMFTENVVHDTQLFLMVPFVVIYVIRTHSNVECRSILVNCLV